jgi:hypothetical protein
MKYVVVKCLNKNSVDSGQHMDEIISVHNSYEVAEKKNPNLYIILQMENHTKPKKGDIVTWHNDTPVIQTRVI